MKIITGLFLKIQFVMISSAGVVATRNKSIAGKVIVHVLRQAQEVPVHCHATAVVGVVTNNFEPLHPFMHVSLLVTTPTRAEILRAQHEKVRLCER
jgi:hypothetical protein